MQNISGFVELAQNRLALPGRLSPEIGDIAPNGRAVVTGSESVDFSRVLEGALDHVSGIQKSATEMQTNIELGVFDDLVGTMIASQKASLAFQGVIQARNRIVSAYETVFNMQV